MRASWPRSSQRDGVALLLLGSLALLLVAIPVAPEALAGSSVLSTVSSATCENDDSLFSSSFSCSLNVTAGSTVVVFLGCLTGTSANCNSASVVDSQGDK